MNSEIIIAECEWKIMELFWENPMLTITEVKSLTENMGWSESTVKTMVRRLVDKGALVKSSGSSQFIYSPAVSKEECQLREIKMLADRAFDSSVKNLLSCILKDLLNSKTDTEMIIELIENKQKSNN